MTPKEAVQEYQCPGCVSGPYPDCYFKGGDLACVKHCVGTRVSGIGLIFLGLPKGFNRLGACEKTRINIFEKFKDGWGYGKFNYPVWKYLDKHNNTIVRGICPRINSPFIHIFLENCLSKIRGYCYEIRQNDLDEMD